MMMLSPPCFTVEVPLGFCQMYYLVLRPKCSGFGLRELFSRKRSIPYSYGCSVNMNSLLSCGSLQVFQSYPWHPGFIYDLLIGLFVCLLACQQDCAKTTVPIFKKLGGMVKHGPTKNSTFWIGCNSLSGSNKQIFTLANVVRYNSWVLWQSLLKNAILLKIE